jgi:hypothetical protein
VAAIRVVAALPFARLGRMKLGLPAWGLIALGFAASLVAAPPELYRVGDTFASFTTKDQHDRSYTFERGVRVVIVAFEMGAGKAANAFFEKQPANFLDTHRAIFVSNIHGMPGIGRMFALPKMKKYPHRILLADAPDFLARYPAQEDMLTVFSLDDGGAITAIRHVNPKQEMARIFAPAK